MGLPCGHEFSDLIEVRDVRGQSCCQKCGTVFETAIVREYAGEGRMKKLMGIGEGEDKKEPLNG